MLATFLWCLACASRRIARELGVPIRTSDRWGWGLRKAALSYELQRQVDGTVEADDLSHTAGYRAHATQGGTKVLGRRARGRRMQREPGRGPDDQDRPAIIAWGSRQGCVANFAQEVMKGQLSLLVEGLRGQSVELFGRSEAFVSGPDYQLFLLDHVPK